MIHLPIVERELRVAARRAGTYWGRVGAGLAALAMVAWSVMAGAGTPGAATRAGRMTFLTIAVVALVSAVMTALRLTAPALAGERREGTLGLLFLTDLRPRDIVLGKLAVTSLTTFFQFLAAVPALAIPLMLGGVTAGDFIRLLLMLVNMMLLAAAVGMFASALARDERNAYGLGLVLLLVVLLAGPVAALLAWWWGAPLPVWFAGLIASPAFACFGIVGSTLIGSGSLGFWISFTLGHAGAWGFLGLTCWVLPRVWRERPDTAPQARRRERWKSFAHGNAAQRLATRRWLLAVNPILWLTGRDRTAPWYPWVFLAAVGALIVWTKLKFDARWTEPALVLGLFWLVHAIFKTWVASHAAYALSADRDRGALELVLSTPLTTGELLRGHWMGLRWLFGVPLVFMLIIEFVWVAVSLASDSDGNGQATGTWVLAYVANGLLLGLDLWAAGWVGLWAGVVGRSGNEAAGRTQMRLFWLPWIGVMLLQAIGGAFFGMTVPFPTLVVAWAVFGVAVDMVFAGRARRKLAEELRPAALLRAAGQPVTAFGWLATAGRWLGHAWAGRG